MTIQQMEYARSPSNDKKFVLWVRTGNTACRAVPFPSYKSVLQLEELRVLLVKLYGLPLAPSQRFLAGTDLVKNVKEFCGGLLDRCVSHPWIAPMRENHACLRTRLSIASSLFSLRKLLPGTRPNPNDYVRKMRNKSPRLSDDFAAFCHKKIVEVFPQGWDRSYWDHVSGFTPPTTSHLSSAEDGTYREQAAAGLVSREDFLRCASGSPGTVQNCVRPKVVLAGGKWRVITLAPRDHSHLKPLHKTLYSAMSKKKWLLRGEAEPSSFDEFGRREGEVFVSGDYESATDNLNINLSRLMLMSLFSTATHIPSKMRIEAIRSLTCDFVSKEMKFLGRQGQGQMMGNLLSFPLLCLANYLAFSYSVPREVPVRINGDDIVFRCTHAESLRWFRFVEESGLKVSRGKTLVHRRIFSLNSSYFMATDHRPEMNPLLRSSCCLKKCEDIVALTGRVKRIEKDFGRFKSLAVPVLQTLIRKNLPMIYSAQGSFSRRYRCALPASVLTPLRLKDRESFYQGLSFEPEPLPKYLEKRQRIVPVEWKKEKLNGMRRAPLVDPDTVTEVMVEGSWTSPILMESRDEYWSRVRDGSFRYVPFTSKTHRLYRLLNHCPFKTRLKKFTKEVLVWTTGGTVARDRVAFVGVNACQRVALP